MALWKFSRLDVWQIRLRVTGSSHAAETEGLETEEPSDVAAYPRAGRARRHHPWVTRNADELWQPTVRGQEETVPGGEDISSQRAVSERGTFCAQMAGLYL